jgi:hypothetical protein
MAVGMDDYEAAMRPVKQQLFKQLFTALPASQPDSSSSSSRSSNGGAVSLLEVGIGTGKGLLPQLSAQCQVAAGYVSLNCNWHTDLIAARGWWNSDLV